MLLLVRHGQTQANVDGLLLGRADPPLTDLGRRQAAALAGMLPRPDRLVSSPLGRATATAAVIAGRCGVPVEVDERWIELDYGHLDGRPVVSVADEEWRRWRADLAYRPAGGESLRSLADRVEPACADLADDAEAGVVVVVSHVSPIKAAIAWALGVPHDVAWRMFVEDASLSRLDFGPHGPVLRWFNRHLAAGPPTGGPAT